MCFLSQDEEAEREKLKERRVAEYQERKSKSELHFIPTYGGVILTGYTYCVCVCVCVCWGGYVW